MLAALFDLENDMIINSSHLALRFYYRDGWTEEILRSCLKRGDVKCSHPEDPEEIRYMILDHTKGSAFDAKKLLKLATRVNRWSRMLQVEILESDLEYIESMNW